jgi:hypothetical protein
MHLMGKFENMKMQEFVGSDEQTSKRVAHEALSLCKLEQNAGAIITRFFLI